MDTDVTALDLQALATWMDKRGLGRGPISDACELTGGTRTSCSGSPGTAVSTFCDGRR
jgi:hypothetical protein